MEKKTSFITYDDDDDDDGGGGGGCSTCSVVVNVNLYAYKFYSFIKFNSIRFTHTSLTSK